jgi:hypothetical protein
MVILGEHCPSARHGSARGAATIYPQPALPPARLAEHDLMVACAADPEKATTRIVSLISFYLPIAYSEVPISTEIQQPNEMHQA